jgi:predicted porin
VLDKDTASNSVRYQSPSFWGFTGSIGYISNSEGQENTGNDGDVRMVPVFLQYENGPLYAGIHYSRTWVEAYKPEGALGDACLSTQRGNGKCGTAKLNNWAVGASYDFEAAKLSAFYDRNTWKNALGTGEDLKLKTWMLGATVPLGRHAILASYNHSQLDGVEAERDGSSKQWALGYTYAFSKRTNFYSAYAHISNGSRRSAGVGDATQDPSDDAEAGGGYRSGFSLGIRHAF